MTRRRTLTRRSFLTASLAMAAGGAVGRPGGLGLEGAREGRETPGAWGRSGAGASTSRAERGLRAAARLTARPVRPFRPVESGETQLGPGLERGALLYVPESYRADVPPPLVLALHGGSGSGRYWRRWYEHAEERGFVLLAPDSRDRTWDRAFGDFGPDLHFIDSALRHTFERCAVDERRVALAGFSDGASYTLSLGPSNGDLFTHLIAFSPGFADPDDEVFGKPRVFISHGESDPVLSFVMARDGIAPLFADAGHETRFVEFAGGHEMPPAVVAEALDWFLQSP